MKVFKLPDLGEGLPNAEIREWYVKVGDEVKLDQPLVAMETAKALVDVPSPYTGVIEKLFGNPGDTIDTGQPLIGFVGEETVATNKDAGTVVGAIEAGEKVIKESATGVIAAKNTDTNRIKATPAVRMLAKQLAVDLATIKPSQGDTITADDVKNAANLSNTKTSKSSVINGELIALSNVRQAMVQSMTESHQHVVPVTLMDDADLHAWKDKEDVTVRIIRAIQSACETVPMLNAYFDGNKLAYKINKEINVGIAVDTPHGLYVPVLKDVAHSDDASLREKIERFKKQAKDRSFPKEDLQGATILFSNFGTFAGKYANPIILPPMVAIVGVGRARDAVVPDNGQPAVHRIMPLSITVDHRAVTGGEAARFLKALIDSLQK